MKRTTKSDLIRELVGQVGEVDTVISLGRLSKTALWKRVQRNRRKEQCICERCRAIKGRNA